MRSSTRALVAGAALIAAGLALVMGWRSRMTVKLAPGIEDLERAYRTHDPNQAGHQRAEAVLADADGVLVLCSCDPKGEGEHTWLLRLGDDGGTRWERHFAAGEGVGRAIAALDGGFVIAGEVPRGEMAYQARLVRVAADGNPIAGSTLGPPGATGFTAVAAPGGSVVAGGAARGHGWLVAVDGALRPSWEPSLDDTDDVLALAPLSDGGLVTAAREQTSSVALGLARLTSYSGDRRVRWQAHLPSSGRGELVAVAPLSDGGVAAVGHHSAGEREATRLWVVRVGADGRLAWERMLGPPDEERRGRAIVALADGGVAVAGEALRGDRRGLRVTRLASDGTVAWERAYGGERYDTARGLARTPDGALVLVGSTMSKGKGKTNVWILKLDGDGHVQWERVLAL